MMRWAAVALMLILPAGACSSPADRQAMQHEVIDSAGIQLVRNGGTADTIELTHDLRIGTVDGPEELQFFRVTALAVAPGGAVLVGDGSGTIREFDAAGTFVRSIGGLGEGPGEFRLPWGIHVYGDTVAVMDARLDRVTEFERTGAVIRTSTLRHENTMIHPVAQVGGEWLVSPREGGWKLEVGKARRDTTRVMRSGRVSLAAAAGDGPAAQTMQPVVEYETGRTYGIAYGSEGMTANSPLWEPRPTHAVDASGNVYLSRGSPYRIDVYDVDGVQWRSITRVHVPVLTTTELNERYWQKVDTYLDTTSNRHGEWHITVAAERGRGDLPVNETLPALGRLIVSDEGMLWAQRPDLLPDPLLLEWTREGTRQDSYWDVFDHEGRFLATVHLPAAFTARAAAGRSLYGVLRDDMDVEHIARFTLPSTF
jgi:hypothetical protein